MLLKYFIVMTSSSTVNKSKTDYTFPHVSNWLYGYTIYGMAISYIS